jgi:hypothetical protein
LIVFTENHALTSRLEILSSEEIDWQIWAQNSGLFNSSGIHE